MVLSIFGFFFNIGVIVNFLDFHKNLPKYDESNENNNRNQNRASEVRINNNNNNDNVQNIQVQGTTGRNMINNTNINNGTTYIYNINKN